MEKRPVFDTYKEYMKWRLDRRVQLIQDRADKCMRRYVDKLSEEDAKTTESDRLWLDQFAVGNGLDIACGDFLIGDQDQAVGVDGDRRYIGADFHCEGDELAFQSPETLDYVVTNYLEGMPNPINALNEWWRVLRPGGTLALICRDANSYPPKYLKGALSNGSRQNTYTSVTLGHYLYRAGFTDYKFEVVGGGIRASAVKEKT
jgi:SAM-dependent methyltransferase